MNPSPNTPPEDTPAAPVAVVVIPAAVRDEVWHTLQTLREFMAGGREADIGRLRARDRFLGLPQTIPTRQR